MSNSTRVFFPYDNEQDGGLTASADIQLVQGTETLELVPDSRGSDRTEAVETVTTAPGEEETSAVVEHEAEKPVEEDTGRK